ncbi:hypothetical protein [Neobacillus sp. DY30]|uniref:hypothetical protein n=1 Tax=Neobacillus sp. DY30 TaxID=3047871 RepID=UPI0024C07125|nr:hypothetical protein [Neobacillus sp. DY30]WHY01085.1 hypothetical protein QNH29_02135 [Neobacillus sp. DY30]
MFLLTFLSFTVLHHSNVITQSHHADKAVLMIDDSIMKSQNDDDQKHLFHLHFVGVLILISLIVVILQKIFLRIHNRIFIFLTPVFHQSNYVISPPHLIS